jgi:amino acid transporter
MNATANGLSANTLGVGAITFFVVSAAGPLVAIAGGVPVAMLLGNGAGIPATFAIALAILLTFAAGFTAMSQYVKSAGGFYAFAAHGLGGYAAGSTATIAVFSYSSIQLALYGLFGAATSTLIADDFHLHLAWWVYSLMAIGVIGVLGYRQIDLSVRVLSVLVLCEYLVVLILDFSILREHTAEISVAPFTASVIASGSPWMGLLWCFACFIGFEATTIYSEEARDPASTIPLATYVSLLLIGAFYAFSSWCMVLAPGTGKLMAQLAELPDVTTFLFQLSDHYVGTWLTLAMRMLFLTSIFAGMLAFHNSIARYFFAMGRDRLIPQALGRTHRIHRSPHRASLVQTASGAVLLAAFVAAGADPVAVLFARVGSVGTLGVIALMSIASAAVSRYFAGRPGNLWRVRILPVVATASLLCLLALACLRFDALAGGTSPLIMWLPLFLLLAALVGLAMADRLRRRDLVWFRELGRVVKT